MAQPTDHQVWLAMEAGQNEAKTWRIIDFRARGALAVNDGPRSLPDIDPNSPVPTTESYESHQFRDADQARRFIEWRSIKAALTAYEKVRQT